MDTLNWEIRRKKSSFHPDDYFDDGKRQIDLILVWKKYPEGKNQDGSPVDLEKFQKRNAQREALFLEVSKKYVDRKYVDDKFVTKLVTKMPKLSLKSLRFSLKE